MNKFQSFQEFLTTQSVKVPVFGFVINILLAALLAYILSVLYVRYADSLSNRKKFAGNFVLITMTTMIIITIVKSSLALSLGLVGALSIVRFRAAIKEPTELAYIFLAISLGLGFGADQRVITIVGFVIVALFIVGRFYLARTEDSKNLHITISTSDKKKMNIDSIVDVLKKHCTEVELRRFDENENSIDAAFLVEYDSFEKMNESKKELQNQDQSMKITFMDNLGIMN